MLEPITNLLIVEEASCQNGKEDFFLHEKKLAVITDVYWRSLHVTSVV